MGVQTAVSLGYLRRLLHVCTPHKADLPLRGICGQRFQIPACGGSAAIPKSFPAAGFPESGEVYERLDSPH